MQELAEYEVEMVDRIVQDLWRLNREARLQALLEIAQRTDLPDEPSEDQVAGFAGVGEAIAGGLGFVMSLVSICKDVATGLSELKKAGAELVGEEEKVEPTATFELEYKDLGSGTVQRFKSEVTLSDASELAKTALLEITRGRDAPVRIVSHKVSWS